MDDSLFLIATIDVDTALSNPANWVVTTGTPYTQIDPVDVPVALTDELFSIYVRTYKKLGAHLQKAIDLFEYNRWILIRNKNGDLVAFLIFKTTIWGLKLGVVGSDGSRQGKDCLVALLTKALNVECVYAEVSPPLEEKLADTVPQVSARIAKQVLEKDIEQDDDGYHYRRIIKEIGPQKKLLVGRPSSKFA